jgi:hypothetical protein
LKPLLVTKHQLKKLNPIREHQMAEWHGRIREVHVDEIVSNNRRFAFWLTGDENEGTTFCIPYDPSNASSYERLCSAILCAVSQNWWIEVAGNSANEIKVVGFKMPSALLK